MKVHLLSQFITKHEIWNSEVDDDTSADKRQLTMWQQCSNGTLAHTLALGHSDQLSTSQFTSVHSTAGTHSMRDMQGWRVEGWVTNDQFVFILSTVSSPGVVGIMI